MSDVYEYRHASSKGVIWLSLIGAMLLLAAVWFYNAYHLLWMVWVLGAVTIAWILIPKRVAGIRLDHRHLTLSAWHQPRDIPLDDIAHLRVTAESFESDVAIVYKNGDEEGVFAGDLPDIDTLIFVMAERGIPVRDVV